MQAHPLQNRVTPHGSIESAAARGLFYGNRGNLHDSDGEIVRLHRLPAWIICVLEFKGRRRKLLQPNRYTELFFCDEATALAAGHRPCYECRRADARHFATAWQAGHGGDAPRAPAIDAVLTTQRLQRDGHRPTYPADASSLPVGTMVLIDGHTHLVGPTGLRRWSHAGYVGSPTPLPDGQVEVLTPRATVATIAAGYEPVLHPSA